MVAKIFLLHQAFHQQVAFDAEFFGKLLHRDAFGDGNLAIYGRRLERFLTARDGTDASLFILAAAIGAAGARLGRVTAAGIGWQRRGLRAQRRRRRMHRASTRRSTGTTRARRSTRTTGSAHQRLARTHRAGINRTAWNRARGASGGHSRARSTGCRSTRHGGTRESRHHIGARWHHWARGGLPHQIRFRGRTQGSTTALPFRWLRRGRSGHGPRSSGTRRRRYRRHRSAGPGRAWGGHHGRRRGMGRRSRLAGGRGTQSRRGLGSIAYGRRHRLARSRKNLAGPWWGRGGARGNYGSAVDGSTRSSGLPSGQWRTQGESRTNRRWSGFGSFRGSRGGRPRSFRWGRRRSHLRDGRRRFRNAGFGLTYRFFAWRGLLLGLFRKATARNPAAEVQHDIILERTGVRLLIGDA